MFSGYEDAADVVEVDCGAILRALLEGDKVSSSGETPSLEFGPVEVIKLTPETEFIFQKQESLVETRETGRMQRSSEDTGRYISEDVTGCAEHHERRRRRFY